MPKAPPKFVRSIGAWEYTLAKLADKGKLTPNGDPQNYAAAVAIYKHVCAKYPAFQMDNRDRPTMKVGEHKPEDFGKFLSVQALDEDYPVGQMFWFDDVLCEAVAKPNIAIHSDAEGNLLVWAKVLDVDPEGAHKTWPEGHEFGAWPHRCAAFEEA